VTGHEQFAHAQSAHATARVERVQDHLPEELLRAPHRDRGELFRGPGGRTQSQPAFRLHFQHVTLLGPSKPRNASSLCAAISTGASMNSAHTVRSRLLAPSNPRMPRARSNGSSEAKLHNFIATLFDERCNFLARSMISAQRIR
jgi:hypothetical protein